MKLNNLLDHLNYTAADLPDADIINVTSDSRKVAPGTLFICIEGEKADGHDFAGNAARSGCAAIVALRQTGAPVPHIIVKDTRYAYSLICANFFGNPAKRLRLIGVTGTNGKTTTAIAIKHILEECGYKSGLIGTMQNMAGDEVFPAHYTTPEPFELQQLFRKMVDAGCSHAVMEVSSHALAQERVAGCHFIAGVFTNLTQDHLDFHKTMENYLAAKQKLFAMSDIGVINLDDRYAQEVIEEALCETVTYSAKNMSADYTAGNIKYRNDGVDYEIVGRGVIGRVSVAVPGIFSVYNTLAAAACALSIGIPFPSVLKAMKTFRGVKGRVEVVPTGRDFSIIIDYAVTPDAVEKILKTVKSFAKGRIVALFGCGGDRDKTKRPKMGRLAAENADFLVITSDNPRSEEPEAIINDIVAGLEGVKTPYVTIVNRPEAIEYAMTHAQKDDTILLMGKGHEDYQILKTGTIHLDEREVIAEVLKKMR